MGRKVRDSNAGNGRNFPLLQYVETGFTVQPASYSKRTAVLSRGRGVDNSRTSSVSVNNEWSYASNFTFLGAFAKLRKATTSFIMYVCPRGTSQLLLDVLSRNVILVYFF